MNAHRTSTEMGWGRGTAPFPRPHPQKQNAAVYTKVWTHLIGADRCPRQNFESLVTFHLILLRIIFLHAVVFHVVLLHIVVLHWIFLSGLPALLVLLHLSVAYRPMLLVVALHVVLFHLVLGKRCHRAGQDTHHHQTTEVVLHMFSSGLCSS